MAREKLFKNIASVVEGEYTLRSWLDLYTMGKFNPINNSILVDMGGYDWFCGDATFQTAILKDFAPKIVALCKSTLISIDMEYVFFKNTQPLEGPNFNEFKICSLKTGNVMYCISHLKKGCYGNDFSGWEVWDHKTPTVDHTAPVVRGTWKDVKKYFGV